MGRHIRWKNTPALPGKPYCPTTLEHVANCVTHSFLVPISVLALFRLYSKSSTQSELLTSTVYGVTIVCLFLASSAFHICAFLARNSSVRAILHVLDRIAIYLFIAGSYTPWLVLRPIHPHWGLVTLFVVWTWTLAGIALQCMYHEKCQQLGLLFYFGLGFLPAFTLVYMNDWAAIELLASGGAIYSLGFVFFKLDGHVPMAHAIWHCFVTAGAYVHFCAVDGFLLSGWP